MCILYSDQQYARITEKLNISITDIGTKFYVLTRIEVAEFIKVIEIKPRVPGEHKRRALSSVLAFKINEIQGKMSPKSKHFDVTHIPTKLHHFLISSLTSFQLLSGQTDTHTNA